MNTINPGWASRLALTLTLGVAAFQAYAFDPIAGDFSKEQSTDIRVLDWNTEKKFISSSDADDNFAAVLGELDPDIIVFEEINDSALGGIEPAAEDIATSLGMMLGGTWYVYSGMSDGYNQNAVASRWELSMQQNDTDPGTDVRGVTCALVDLPDATYSVDFYVMGVHFKSGDGDDSTALGTNEQRRQSYADGIVNWMRDARTTGENIDLPTSTPMLAVGDMNLNFGSFAPYTPYETLLTGDIYDETTYGADSAPDWDGSEAADAFPYDYNTGDSDSHSSNYIDPDSRYDRFIYTDSVMYAANAFIVNSLTMSAGALSAAGFDSDETDGTADAPDHLPLVVDFRFGTDPNAGLVGRMMVNEFNYDDPGADDSTFIELKNIGEGEINLAGPVAHYLALSNTSTGTLPSSEIESARFKLEGVIPPGGIFVLYDSVGESSAIASTIEAALPGAQRQDLSTFSLYNGDNQAFAVVTSVPTDGSTVDDTLVEAYVYSDTDGTSDNYFMTDSSNELLITFGSDQTSVTDLSSTAESFSRNRGDETTNSLSGWTIPDAMTPGEENNTEAVPVEVSSFLIQ